MAAAAELQENPSPFLSFLVWVRLGVMVNGGSCGMARSYGAGPPGAAWYILSLLPRNFILMKVKTKVVTK